MNERPRRRISGFERALEELQFGHERKLDLRAGLPTPVEAERRAEAWLRERQATLGGTVLIVTGRGRASADGIPVVLPAIQRALARLHRQGVVDSVQRHTAGSLLVTLAPLSRLLAAAQRRRDPPIPVSPDPAGFALLAADTRAMLRQLAVRSLEVLGAQRVEPLVSDEMQRQFSRLVAVLPVEGDRDALLRDAARAALDALDTL